MMRRRVLIGLAALLVYAVALVATMPAERALSWGAGTARNSGVAIAASGVAGTVWHGNAASVSINGITAGHTEWSLSPWWLALGRLKIHWRAEPEGGWAEGDAVVAGDGITLRNLEGELPAALLVAWFSRAPSMINLDGKVVMRIEELVQRRGRIDTARATLLWKQAALVQPVAAHLGDLKVEFTPGGNGSTNGRLSDGGGPLGLAGNVVLNPDSSYRLDLVLTPRPGGDPVLTSSIPMLGRPDGKGGYQVNWSGKLTP